MTITAGHATADLSFQPLRRRSARPTPCRKKRYRTESDALDAAKHLRRYGYTGQRAYQCTRKNCAAWHLSTKPELTSQAIGRYLKSAAWAPTLPA